MELCAKEKSMASLATVSNSISESRLIDRTAEGWNELGRHNKRLAKDWLREQSMPRIFASGASKDTQLHLTIYSRANRKVRLELVSLARQATAWQRRFYPRQYPTFEMRSHNGAPSAPDARYHVTPRNSQASCTEYTNKISPLRRGGMQGRNVWSSPNRAILFPTHKSWRRLGSARQSIRKEVGFLQKC